MKTTENTQTIENQSLKSNKLTKTLQQFNIRNFFDLMSTDETDTLTKSQQWLKELLWEIGLHEGGSMDIEGGRIILSGDNGRHEFFLNNHDRESCFESHISKLNDMKICINCGDGKEINNWN